MINSIIQTIIENKDFLEKSLEESVKASEISMFSRDLRKRTVMTDYGNIEYLRRYYRNKKTKEYVYLADEKMGIEKNERIMKDVESKIIEFAHDVSYSKTGKQVVGNEIISPTTVMKKVRKEELKV